MVNKILNNPQFRHILEEIDFLENNRIFCCHGMEHLLNVARISTIIVLENGYEIDRELIYSASLLHDIGRAKEYEIGGSHAVHGVEIANQILTECDFSKKSIDEILLAISSHNNQHKTNKLGEILRSADKLSRNCFCCKAVDKCKWAREKMNMEISI